MVVCGGGGLYVILLLVKRYSQRVMTLGKLAAINLVHIQSIS